MKHVEHAERALAEELHAHRQQAHIVGLGDQPLRHLLLHRFHFHLQMGQMMILPMIFHPLLQKYQLNMPLSLLLHHQHKQS